MTLGEYILAHAHYMKLGICVGLLLAFSWCGKADPLCVTVPSGRHRLVSGNVSLSSLSVPDMRVAPLGHEEILSPFYRWWRFDDFDLQWFPSQPHFFQGEGDLIIVPAETIMCFNDP